METIVEITFRARRIFSCVAASLLALDQLRFAKKAPASWRLRGISIEPVGCCAAHANDENLAAFLETLIARPRQMR